MTQAAENAISPLHIAKILATYRWRWVLPLTLTTAASVGYALLRPPVWEASQPLLVRDEAAGSPSRPGEFDSAEKMKTAQETVLELARSRSVVAAALKEIGPPDNDHDPRQWPSRRDVEKAQRNIQISPPRGAEFGSTEVFYLTVKDRDPQRAVELAKAVGDQVDRRSRELRDNKAESLVQELTITANLARADLDRATAELSQIEREVGDDLAELRILSESANGESNLRQTLIQLKNEHRQALVAHATNQQLLEMLQAARSDPNRLTAAPNQLLETQPALRQLKDGLVDAQLTTARLLGEMTDKHPKAQAAAAVQDHIRGRLNGELEMAIQSLEAELQLSASRLKSIEKELADVTGRMSKLAGMRAGYSNLLAEVQRRGETLKQAEHELSSARASQAAALSASLLTRLDEPATGDYPIGPRKAVIALAGCIGGLLVGWGVVFLTVPGAPSAPAADAVPTRPTEETFSASGGPAAAEHGLSLKQALRRIAQSTASRN